MYCIYNIKRGSEHLKHHGKSTQKRYKFDAGKKYVKCNGNVPKMEPKWEPKSAENRKHMRKIINKSMQKKTSKTGTRGGRVDLV